MTRTLGHYPHGQHGEVWKRGRTWHLQPGDATLYVIQAGLTGPIKIGVARDAEKRRRYLQIGHYEDLRLIATGQGGVGDERDLHELLRPLWIRGEWFLPEALDEAVRQVGRAAIVEERA